MKFFTLIFVILCGVHYISTAEPSNDGSLLSASVIDEISQLIQAAVENLSNQTELFIQKIQEDFQNLIQSSEETIDKYANATAKQVDDLIGNSVSYRQIKELSAHLLVDMPTIGLCLG